MKINRVVAEEEEIIKGRLSYDTKRNYGRPSELF